MLHVDLQQFLGTLVDEQSRLPAPFCQAYYLAWCLNGGYRQLQ
jgi:hypothetical protein